jgi:hypothetical protein
MPCETQPDPLPVTASDLLYLRDTRPQSDTGYHGVYPDKTSGTFHARFFQKRICSGMPTARAAAQTLIRHWKATFGTNWRKVWHLRQTQGWVVWRAPGGWWAEVDACGEGGRVIGRHPEYQWACEAEETPGCRPFPSEQSARRGVVAWAKRQWGNGRRFVIRRAWAPGRSAARQEVLRVSPTC